MTKIKQLPESVANQISAGEVVERPASVVKELLENSIDAGSKNILIEIEEGGREKIRVKDDGSGIPADEMELAFSRYATSKIEEINDLYSIKTLGFRGEALASISSVSNVVIKSRTAGELQGIKMELKGGSVLGQVPVGIPAGTDIEVTGLFYNTPARYKYLKKVNTEFAHISKIVTREALAYPDIKFTLIHNHKEVYKTPGTGKLIDAVYTLYGSEIASNLTPIDYEDRYIRLTGLIGNQTISRSSRIYEVFFVNKRVVNSRTLSQGVEEAYHGVLPARKYPVVFLNVVLNQILIDVNVHPTKREVKFSRDGIIKDVLKKGISKTLQTKDLIPKIKKKHLSPKKERLSLINDNKLKQGIEDSESKEYQENFKGDFIRNNYKEKTADMPPRLNKYRKQTAVKENLKLCKVSEEKDSLENNKPFNKNIDKDNNNDLVINNFLGQLYNTYLVTEGSDGLIIIDQHNAHERILYEKIRNKFADEQINTQALLLPVRIDFTAEEIELVKKYLTDLKRLGFNIDFFGGNSILVQGVPSFLKNRPIKVIVEEIVDSILKKGKTGNKSDLLDQVIKYMSCRGAIKAGKHLAEKEIDELIKGLIKASNPYRCPHGRPIIVNISLDDIKRGLGRK
ncbi:DNA mismatch repair endonuclease MutL [Halocella sp. SP3-1]|uniref:DNA mismatch repair endonuclease MutL n=1 Tax=Halocella sp. SP3-1 TaxID=2382161 RepID=UPI000F76314E|nr:DNA mismatch repair endonuclease MutL [Halocella sp. SP3-1]AZO95422.1 DNA mismatch repair endonuclease MutL [Halocella sp. SP3-1]